MGIYVNVVYQLLPDLGDLGGLALYPGSIDKALGFHSGLADLAPRHQVGFGWTQPEAELQGSRRSYTLRPTPLGNFVYKSQELWSYHVIYPKNHRIH